MLLIFQEDNIELVAYMSTRSNTKDKSQPLHGVLRFDRYKSAYELFLHGKNFGSGVIIKNEASKDASFR